NTRVVKTLLDHHADVSAVDNNGQTPLHYAAELQNARVTKMLLARHADVQATDNEGLTPLHYAAWFGKKDVVTVLLEHGADLTARDNLGQTPLHYAVDNEEVDLAITLLNHGAETNAADNNGNTVLHLAARRRNVNMIEILLLYCPDMTLRNYQRKRPADIARESGMVVLATIMQGQRSTPCVVEGTECQTEGGSGVAPLRLLTCSNTTWRTPAPVPPTSTTL
ncbi:hypothetical protein OTU49_013641, partial [Cherax quadricarinatus]